MNETDIFCAEVDVSRETLERLTAFDATLRKWNPAINLVSAQTLDQIWTRHMLDSAQLLTLSPVSEGSWVDLGSGGGFPGLVIAILAKEKHPGFHVTLIESDKRKAAFLATAARAAQTDVRILAERIETSAPQNARILSARALAPLTDLLGYAERHLMAGGICLFPKGARWREEVETAKEFWSFDLKTHASLTDPESVVLEIEGAHRV